MSKRQQLIKLGNIIGFFLTILAIYFFYQSKESSIYLLYGIICMAIVPVFILIMNSLIYKEGKNFVKIYDNFENVSFQIDANYKQLLIDVIWEIKGLKSLSPTHYTITLQLPNKEIRTFNGEASSVTSPNIPQDTPFYLQFNVYHKDNDQYVIESPEIGEYILHVNLQAEEGFNIKELRVTAWN